ncbi:class I SAM-dependent methyltransferase [Sporolactobacillus sp. THM7-4]|nr:class I SAM-dependent methyltransferase [Sporolactobacillus sp. THM7-4]
MHLLLCKRFIYLEELNLSTVSELFSVLDQSSILIKKLRGMDYLEALCETAENIYNDVIKENEIRDKLEPLYANFFREGLTAEDIRRAFQLAALKGMKKSPHPNHEITPDSIVLLLGHIASLLTGDDPVSILDPAVGTGNLLTGIMNQVKNNQVTACGADTDDLLIKLAYANSNLQQKEVHLFHQDGLKPLFVEPCDLVVCDVPVGIYPDERTAKAYELSDVGEKAYTHFLFIEQGLKSLKNSGYLLYLIPNRLFAEDRDHHFHQFIQDKAVILALLQLPLSLFKNRAAAKSVFLLQKKGEGVKMPKQALLAEMPQFSDEQELRRFMLSLDDWFKHRL